MDTQPHSLTETTEDYKYYLTKNTNQRKIRCIELCKVGKGIIETITYLRLPEGSFNITRTIHPYQGEKPELGGREIDYLEFEIISQESLKAADTFARLLSYFDDERIEIGSLRRTYERDEICEKLGIPLFVFNPENIPNLLQDSIPWISNQCVMVTKECIDYLETMKDILSVDKENINSIWFRIGVENLLKQIYENYPNFRRI